MNKQTNDVKNENKQRKFKNPPLTQNEKRKREFNEKGYVMGYPQVEGVPNLPLPENLSHSLKMLESRFYLQIDEFVPTSSMEILTKTQYLILVGGVKNNMTQLQMNEKIWNNHIQLSDQVSTTHSFIICVSFNYRIHLEGLRLMTGKSLMDILYLGEINIQNEFDKVDNQIVLNPYKLDRFIKRV